MTPNEALASLLGEIKHMEGKLDGLRQKRDGLEGKIKAALRSGDREGAQKLAAEYERLGAEVARLERMTAKSREELEDAKRRTKDTLRDADKAKTLGATAQALEQVNAAMDLTGETDDMLRTLDEEAALAEAKLDLATERAEADLEEPPRRTGEDVLAEFEGGGGEGDEAGGGGGAGSGGAGRKKSQDEPPPRSGAEDILAEFEKDL